MESKKISTIALSKALLSILSGLSIVLFFDAFYYREIWLVE
jgi:hypothetical protein